MNKLVHHLAVFTLGIAAPALADADIEAGKASAMMCSACHGIDGNSSLDMYPKLAGQHAKYLEKQLQDFKLAMTSNGASGRADAIMGGMSVGLTEQDMKNIAAYYASQKQTGNETAKADKLGEQLYKFGDMKRGITACSACHGPAGKGMEAAGFPMIAGQHATYLQQQLSKFKKGVRSNDLNGMMSDVSKKLTAEDMQALSSYIASLK